MTLASKDGQPGNRESPVARFREPSTVSVVSCGGARPGVGGYFDGRIVDTARWINGRYSRQLGGGRRCRSTTTRRSCRVRPMPPRSSAPLCDNPEAAIEFLGAVVSEHWLVDLRNADFLALP